MLKRQGGVVTAGWPVGAAPDMVLHRAGAYVEELIPQLRKGISKAEMPAKKKGNAPVRACKWFVCYRFWAAFKNP